MRGGPGTTGDLGTTPASENVKLKNKNKFVQSRQEPTLGKTAGRGLCIGRLEERIPHNGGQRGRNKKCAEALAPPVLWRQSSRTKTVKLKNK